MSRWFRWYEGTSEDGKFRAVARNANVTVATVMGTWAALLEDASHPDHRGLATRGEGFWAAVLDLEEELLITILSAMEDIGLISVGHGAITITKWKERQFETDEKDPTNAIRQKRWRQKHQENKSETQHNDTVTETKRPDTDTDTDTDKKKKDSRAVAVATLIDKFEEFWRDYPKRDGANPKKPAAKKFGALVLSGVDAHSIISGMRNYATECRSKGIVGTSFVAQAIVFLNQNRWEDYAIAPTETEPIWTKPPPGARTHEEILATMNGQDHAEASGAEIRSDPGVGENGPDQPEKLLLSG